MNKSNEFKKNIIQKWDPQQYNSNSTIQFEASKKILNQLQLKGTENILDIGCGDGKITALISSYIPKGKIIGLDLSYEMIEFAKERFSTAEYKNLSFVNQDASKIQFNNQFEIIFSSFAIHWITDFPSFIKKINLALQKEGKIAFTIPLGISEPLEMATTEAFANPSWKHYFNNNINPWQFPKSIEYKQMILDADFDIISFEVISQIKIFKSRLAFENYVIQWYPYMNYIDQDKREIFFNELISRYLEIQPASPSGEVYFEFPRLDVIAKKE